MMGNKYNFFSNKDSVLRVLIQSNELERFINLLWKNNVVLMNIKKETINSMSFDINYGDYNITRKLAYKTRSKIKIIKRTGIVFLKIKLKRRIAMVLGILVFIGLITYLSNFIWGIDISTEKNVSPYEIREELKNIGVVPGTYKRNLNVYVIEEELKKNNDNIMWVRVRMEGSKLKVTLVERQALPEVVNDKSPCNIVAKKDGIITRVYTKAGTTVVKSGDVVKKGQLLVVGEQGKEGAKFNVHASGDVIAKTYYDEAREIPLSYLKKTRTGNSIKNYFIDLFGKKFYFKNSLNKFVKYDKIEEDDNFIKKETYYEVKDQNVKLDAKIATEKTASLIYKNIILKFNRSVNIVNKMVESSVEGNMLKVRVLVTTEENIAEVQK